MTNKIIQSYVYHGDKCWFVSTINRESSSMCGGTYAETMVWEWNEKEMKRLDMVFQDEHVTDSIFSHIKICKRINETGDPQENEDD